MHIVAMTVKCSGVLPVTTHLDRDADRMIEVTLAVIQSLDHAASVTMISIASWRRTENPMREGLGQR
jgi:hypothetical protein